MRINHNIASLNTYRQLTQNTSSTSKSLEKLSSGLRINRAGDDAAGLAISEKMRGQIRGLDQAASNAQDGISMIQTAEGALNETHSILQRMRELAVQSATDTNTASDRAEIQKEVDQLATEITRIANDTEFNTQKLLNGGVTTGALGESTFHIGANAGQSLNISINAMDAVSLGVAGSKYVGTVTGTGDTTAASITGSAPALVDGNVITATVTQVVVPFGGTLAAGSSGIGAITATSGGSVLDGKTIAVSTAVDTAADAGTLSAAYAAPSGSAATLSVKIDGAASATDITIADGATIGDATNAINTALNTALGTTGVLYASNDGTNISITSNTTGASSSVAVSSTAIGFTTGAADTGTAEDYAVTFNDGTTSVTVTNVAANAASVAGTGVYSTLSFATVGSSVSTATAGTINIGAAATSYTMTLSDSTRTNSVITGLAADAATVAGTGDFEGVNLTLDGALAAGSNTITLAVTSGSAATFLNGEKTADAVNLGGIDVSTKTAANSAITKIEAAVTTVSAERSKLGAVQNRLEHTINNLSTSSENLTASESRIRDVDMAKEMMAYTKNNILTQAATAMLAQANQQPQGVLQLLQ